MRVRGMRSLHLLTSPPPGGGGRRRRRREGGGGGVKPRASECMKTHPTPDSSRCATAVDPPPAGEGEVPPVAVAGKSTPALLIFKSYDKRYQRLKIEMI